MSNDYWQGPRVRLRGVEPTDWEMFYEADRDGDAARRLYWIPLPRGKEATRQWAAKRATESPDGDAYAFVIENLDGQAVGTVSTHECNRRMGTFKYGVAINERHRGKGYASEAIKLILRYYFGELGYQKVTAEVYSFNEESKRLHEKLGFQLEGRLRRMVRTGGTFHDNLIFGMTAEEFQALQTEEELEGGTSHNA